MTIDEQGDDWIDIEVEKPPFNVEVVILTEWGKVTTDVYSDWSYAEGFDNYNGDVTHWQFLPKPLLTPLPKPHQSTVEG